MQEIIYYCDVCGKRFTRGNVPPWYPELCPKHLKEHLERQNALSTYTYKEDPKNKIQVWY